MDLQLYSLEKYVTVSMYSEDSWIEMVMYMQPIFPYPQPFVFQGSFHLKKYISVTFFPVYNFLFSTPCYYYENQSSNTTQKPLGIELKKILNSQNFNTLKTYLDVKKLHLNYYDCNTLLMNLLSAFQIPRALCVMIGGAIFFID